MKKAIICIIAVIIILITAFQIWKVNNINQKQVAVLVYHDIVKDPTKTNYEGDVLSSQEFEDELKYLKEKGYQSISVEELYEWKHDKKEIPDKSVVITFDDGFYSFKHIAQPILKKYDYKAICFLIGKTVGETTPDYQEKVYGTIGIDEIKKHDANITYGSHTFNLHSKTDDGKPYVTAKSKEELENDTKKFKNTLFEPKYLAYPYYTYSKEYIEVLKDNNYYLAFAGEEEMATKHVDDFKVPRISGVKEFKNFKQIFETDKYRNKYGNGLIRKVILKIKRREKS